MWKCKVCQRETGDMKLLGNGLIQCLKCGTLMLVKNNGEVVKIK
jgi:DNA-directed RNA polymerase subunit RPC12/RpoP